MTAFAINSGGVEYYDQKTGGSVNSTLDTYTISNESTLVVRTDTYACANHSTAFGSLDNVAYSGVGGEVLVDPTYVRYVSYTSGSGNSPAFGAAISQGGVSGVFLGVWANWQSEPIVPGAAIPSSGFIKIGGVTGGAFSAGSLTGITATCSGADLQCWIEVRGADTAAITAPRVGSFECDGGWFELGVTSGSRNQVLHCPTTGSHAGVFPAVQIETAVGSDTYEWYVCMGTLAATANAPTDAVRGKICWQTTAGIVIGYDGANNVGYLPVAGCRVRIPNVIFTCCTRSGSGSGPRVVPNTTMVTRMEFNTTSSGRISLTGCVMLWYANFDKTYSLTADHVAFSDELKVVTHATPFDLSSCIVGITQTRVATSFSVTNNPVGGTVDDCFFVRSTSASSAFAVFVTGSANIDFLRTKIQLLSDRTSNSYRSFYSTTSADITLTECVCIGAHASISGGIRFAFNDHGHVDSFYGLTTTSNPQRGITFIAGCVDCEVDGFVLPLAGCQPYLALFETQQTTGLIVQNIGNTSSFLDIGSSGGASAYVLESTGGNANISMRRCYTSNDRASGFLFLNSDTNVRIENFFSDYDSVTGASYLNGYSRGCGFLLTSSAASSVYGVHWCDGYKSATAGEIVLYCNEPTVETAGQVAVQSGVPIFTSLGSVLLPALGVQIIWEMPYFALGHTALANSALTITGTNTGNLSYEFQYDIGAGYNGTWLTANATNFTGVGAIDPAVGIKIKLRVTCVTANASNALTNIRISTVTTSTAQSTNLYPLDTITLTLTGLVAGSDVVVRAAGTSTILASVDSNAGTTWGYVYETPVAIDVDVIKPGYVPKPLLRNYTPSAQDSSLPVSQLLDRNYL